MKYVFWHNDIQNISTEINFETSDRYCFANIACEYTLPKKNISEAKSNTKFWQKDANKNVQ
jgi:hypothetical protein